MTVNQAAGILALLDEDSIEIKVYALQKLNEIVDLFWAEIADQISKIEILYENNVFPQRQLAAIVASKVYYHLGEFPESLQFALAAGPLFDLDSSSEFVDTIIAKAIDKYIILQKQKFHDSSIVIEKGLHDVVMKMFLRCISDKKYHQAAGIALESFRLDLLEDAIVKGYTLELLKFVLDTTMENVLDLKFRNQVLKLLVTLFRKSPNPDQILIAQCFVHLNDPTSAANQIELLISSSEDNKLAAYQVAFDIEENATQNFCHLVIKTLPLPKVGDVATDMKDSAAMEVDAPVSALAKVHTILSGTLSVGLHLEFLFRNNHTDPLILKNTKSAFDSRTSAHHSAISFANAFQNAGTTSDEFLRLNLDWLSKATNWSKFSATAALGVIHKGHLSKSTALLAPYLPQEGVSGSPYSEGGALFALGLIHANHGQSVLPVLSQALKSNQNEVLQHGAALGLGVAGMATEDADIYESLKNVLYNDSAVAGEAAGLSMGLIMLGSGNDKALEEMLQYAHDTEHEKIIRGISVGMAIINLGREEEANTFIEQLCGDSDPIIRYGGIYTVAMAYAGTGNNTAIKRLLHFAVSDVNDDVRRAAVTSLGFILFRNPENVPKIVQLLSESYNPHVRYGATLALGIACSGTGSSDAIEILEPLATDNVNFVRQGALIALGMVLIQHNEQSSSKCSTVRKLYEKIINNKREDLLARVGATLGQGIIDAGGRNVTISLQSRSGYLNIPAIVGMAVFTQFWSWFPLSHFLSLSFTPTCLIGLNRDLEAPSFSISSNCNASLFEYLPMTEPPKVEVIDKVAKAVLSTTIKSEARARKAGKVSDQMDIEEPKASEVEEDKIKQSETELKLISNFSRILPAQMKYLSISDACRYVPLKIELMGIVILKDKTPNVEEEMIVRKFDRPAPATSSTP